MIFTQMIKFRITLEDTLNGLYCQIGAAGLLIDIEYSRLRDNESIYLTSFVTTRIDIELVVIQGKYPTRL